MGNNTKKHSGILGIIAAAAVSRSVINTSNRFIYPFAAFFSRGLGVPLTAVTSIIALNQATAIIGLFTSHLGDKRGYKRMMLSGLILLSAGMAFAGALPTYYTLIIALFLSGLCKNLFDPAIQAYVARRISYKRRGMVVGILEMSWAAATLGGIPAIGILINEFGWRSPFFALAGAGFCCIFLIIHYIKDDAEENGKEKNRQHFFQTIALLLKNPSSLGVAGFGFFASFGNDNLFVIYGAWLEQAFQLNVLALGLGTAVIGVAELCGSTSVALFADRLGLKISVMLGLAGCSLSYLFIPGAETSLVMALAGLFAIFIFFEFSIVGVISICTEVVPESRATMMSLFLASAGFGRVAGASSGGFIWQEMGMGTVCITSALLNLVALVILAWGLWGWNPE